jgi:uncharacterized protein (UPF0332 family)
MSALFYVAVHEIQAALVSSGSRPRGHKERVVALREKWPSLGTLYEALFSRSRQARYECRHHSQAEVVLAEAALQQVKSEIAKLGLRAY